MKYAPVIIPTVSRFDHLKKCIDSLSLCTWAEKTDVFVAVDYPGKEEHVEGYNQVREYIGTIDNLGFKSFNVVYRDHNYFYSGEGNSETLVKELMTKYDRYIFSEDDNVFSPNFLVYMNKGLEMFAKDKSVLAINGYKHPYPVRFDENTFFRQNVDFSAWGFGIWRDRDYLISSLTPSYFREKMNWPNFRAVHRNGNNRLIQFMHLCMSNAADRTDNVLSVLMPLEGMDVVMPRVSLVRNEGWDGSGNNCYGDSVELTQMHHNQSISEDNDFPFVGTGYEHYYENKRIYVKSSYGRQSNLKLLKEIILFLIRYKRHA